MLAINPVGIASAMNPDATLKTSGTYTFDVYLMDGTLPDKSVLENIGTIAEFNTLYTSKNIYKFTGLSFTSTFDSTIQQRTYVKTPIDAIPFTPLINGTIGWFMMITTGNKMIFGDSVGNWDNATSNLTVDNLVCLTSQENILKDLNFIIRDKSSYEINPLGIFNSGV